MGTTAYPGAVDNFATTSPTNLGDNDSTSRTHSERHDDMEAAMEAVQTDTIFSGCSVTRTTAQTISADTSTPVSWDTELFDVGGYWALSPNPTRLVAPTAGKYLITGSIGADGLDAVKDYQCMLYIDGANDRWLVRLSNPSAVIDTFWHSFTAVVALTATQYVEIVVRQGTSTPFSVGGSAGAARTHVQMTRLG